MTLHRLTVLCIALCTILCSGNALACDTASDRACIAAAIQKDAANISEPQWHDQTLRDLAISLTYDKKIDDAVALVPQITNPDTQAMTVRGIGMAASLYGRDSPDALRAVFKKLTKAAAGIQQPAANAIAHTYIAMAQAFGGLDDDAWATAAAMSNDALKHKAFGETAEIQAERGNVDKAMASIGKIDATSYRNKSYQTVAEILIKQDKYDAALKSAQAIDNPAKRAATLQAILRAQETKSRGARQDIINGAVPE